MEIRIKQEKLVVGICDDEQYVHNIVEQMLQSYAESNNVSLWMIHYYSAQQILDGRDELNVLLLDIEMPKMDGIEVGYKLRDRGMDYKIIMLTAREDRYREAFKIGAFRFIPKPVERLELYSAIDDVRKHMSGWEKVTVFRDGVTFQVIQRDILYIEANKSETLIFTDNSEFRSEYSLAAWNKLLDRTSFFQCHKSYIVNMRKIEEIGVNEVRLVSGDRVAVSRRLRSSFRQAFITYDLKWR